MTKLIYLLIKLLIIVCANAAYFIVSKKILKRNNRYAKLCSTFINSIHAFLIVSETF